MIKKVVLVFLLCAASPLTAFEVGMFAGSINHPDTAVIGLSGVFGFMIPMLRLEWEGSQMIDTQVKTLSAALVLKLRAGRFGPYAVFGVGTEFEKFNFRFSEYRGFLVMGAGIHLYLVSVLSMRLDVRLFSLSGLDRTRFSGGLFIHI